MPRRASAVCAASLISRYRCRHAWSWNLPSAHRVPRRWRPRLRKGGYRDPAAPKLLRLLRAVSVPTGEASAPEPAVDSMGMGPTVPKVSCHVSRSSALTAPSPFASPSPWVAPVAIPNPPLPRQEIKSVGIPVLIEIRVRLGRRKLEGTDIKDLRAIRITVAKA